MLSVDNGLCIGDFLWPFVAPKNYAAKAYSHFGNKAMPCANICSACGKPRKHRRIHSNGTHVFTYIYKKSRGLRFGIFVVGPQGFEP